MSRIYSNDSLTTLPVNTCTIHSWSPDDFTKRGDGILLEGCIRGKSRYMIVDGKGVKRRYFVFHIEAKRAHYRRFDASGKEITPNFSQETKISTGYLMSSYKTVAEGKTDKVERSKIAELVHNEPLSRIASKSEVAGALGFWIAEDLVEQLDIDLGDEVRLKTKGNSPFIDQLLRIETASKTVGNMAGDDKVGASWTDKVLATETKAGPPQVEGVDEEEWVTIYCMEPLNLYVPKLRYFLG